MTTYLDHILYPQRLFAALCTIAVISLVFKENKIYRLFEHVYIGLAVGYDIAFSWTDALRPYWWDPMVRDGEWIWIAAVPVGLMSYAIYTRRFEWMSRILFGMFFGLNATTIFQDFCQGFMPQVTKSYKSLVPPPPKPGAVHVALHSTSYIIDNALFMLILLAVITYFFFAFEQRSKVVRGTAQFGRYSLMIAFGAIFGATVMTRMALLIDRVGFVLNDWLRLGPKH